MKIIFGFCGLVLMFATACSPGRKAAAVKEKKQKTEVAKTTGDEPPVFTELRMNHKGCYGKCPEFEVFIKGNGDAIYIGKKNVPRIGHFECKIQRADLEKLLLMAQAINYFELASNYPLNGKNRSEFPSILTYFATDGCSHQVYNNYDAPVPLQKWEHLIVTIIEKQDWVKK